MGPVTPLIGQDRGQPAPPPRSRRIEPAEPGLAYLASCPSKLEYTPHFGSG